MHVQRAALRHSLAAAAIASLLGACSGGDGATPAPKASAGGGLTDADRVEAIASTLQACSYDGSPVRVQPGQLGGQAPADCAQMVDRIMAFTGLPANFVVAAGPVDNALATILLDKDHIPRRIIAFNPDFISVVQRKTGGDAWAPVSIMAHEIGHHLSGHTILPGGSRPAIELEADKFSGFVLQKMGAPLDDATKAILTFGTDADMPTHPAKGRRVAAIRDGWQEACRQAGGSACSGGAGTGTTPGTAQVPATPARVVSLPAPAPTSTPFKYGRFIVDEFGLLDPQQVAAYDRALFEHAQRTGVEIALLLVKDLHGMDPTDYAWAMMRQLRIGKLDVGNGAVLVVAPEQRQAGVAYGPGIAREMENTDLPKRLTRWIDGAWEPVCKKQGNCRAWSETLLMAPDYIKRMTQPLEWTIRYQGMQEFMDAYLADFEARSRQAPGTPYDPARDVANKKIIRFRGKVVSLDTPTGIPVVKPEVLANAAIVKRGYLPVHVQSEDGYPVVFYVDPKIQATLPAGNIRAGGAYTFVGRVVKTSPIKGQAQHLWAMSYDPI